MQCLSPISKLDKDHGRISVPCGRCMACKAKRRNDWSYRLWIEYRNSHSAYFITMTYAQEHLVEGLDEQTGELSPTLFKPHVQSFLKRIRITQDRFYKKHKIKSPQIRYYLCGEYGEITQRPHYHMILFNLDSNLKEKLTELWNLGHVHIGTCNAKTIAYTTKYVMKPLQDSKPHIIKPFSLMSKNPAIGHSYLEKNTKYHKLTLKGTVRNSEGKEQGMPRYLKEKIFTKQERLIIADKLIPIMDAKSNKILAELKAAQKP